MMKWQRKPAQVHLQQKNGSLYLRPLTLWRWSSRITIMCLRGLLSYLCFIFWIQAYAHIFSNGEMEKLWKKVPCPVHFLKAGFFLRFTKVILMREKNSRFSITETKIKKKLIFF